MDFSIYAAAELYYLERLRGVVPFVLESENVPDEDLAERVHLELDSRARLERVGLAADSGDVEGAVDQYRQMMMALFADLIDGRLVGQGTERSARKRIVHAATNSASVSDAERALLQAEDTSLSEAIDEYLASAGLDQT